ncbi:MAG: ArsC family reductase [Sphingomonadales bacterium]|jgi:arsenate reductase
MITIYGIKNCDTVKKALKWLEAEEVDHIFHDFRRDGLDEELLQTWIDVVGWKILLNKRGTTFRNLPDDQKIHVDEISAYCLMLEQVAIIRRPVMVGSHGISVGFTEEIRTRILA